jgi:isopentenyl-diphosphate delta-isomerase
MQHSYYKQKQYIETVDKNGEHLGFMEKWEVHEKGILHRGFGVILLYKNYILLQHRKHPAFDAVLDLSSASHQLQIDGKFENLNDAVIKSLEREWNLKKTDLIGKVKRLDYVYYKEKDPKSIYTEQEYCDVLIVKIKTLPQPNLEFAYGYSLVTKEELYNKKSRIYEYMSPWGKKIIDQKMI